MNSIFRIKDVNTQQPGKIYSKKNSIVINLLGSKLRNNKIKFTELIIEKIVGDCVKPYLTATIGNYFTVVLF